MPRQPKKQSRRRGTRRLRRRLRGGGSQQVPIGPTTINFPATLAVTLNDGTAAAGQLVSKDAATPEPQVSWGPAEPSVFHTLLCFDPDAPAADWLHWLVVNIEGTAPSAGETLVQWAPPTPPTGTGTHRYFFCLFKHAARVVELTPKERGYFKTAEFVRAAGLTPVAATSIRVSSTSKN